MTRRPFKKGYTGQWLEELFVVSKSLRKIPTTYRVKDLVNEHIDGTFYYQELQLVRVEQDRFYTVKRILKNRKKTRIFCEMEGVWRQIQHMDHKRKRHCMILSFSKQTSWINFISDCQQQLHEHLPRKQNIFIRYKTDRRNSPHGTMGDWTEGNTLSTLMV